MVANTLGLNESKYQYVIDALEADELRRQQEEQDEDDRRQVVVVYVTPLYIAFGDVFVLFLFFRYTKGCVFHNEKWYASKA